MKFYRIYNKKKNAVKPVHLMMMEKFTEPYIRDINRLFAIKDNDFIIYGGPIHKGIELHCFKEKNVWTSMNGGVFQKEKYRNFLLSHKMIIIHGLFEEGIISNWARDQELLSKTYVFLYGAYPSKERVENVNYHYILQNAAGIINIYRSEQKIVEDLYHPKGKMFSAFYLAAPYFGLQNVKRVSQDGVIIQIGNSASESMEHMKLIKMLEKYKKEKIKVYAPLSYGNQEYADQVEKYGRKILGDKFIAIRGFMPKQKYIEFVLQINIAIFGTKIQQASDNMDMNLWAGNCLYLYSDSTMAKVYEKEIGCKIKYIENIERTEFEEFKSWKEKEGQLNSERIEKFYSDENFVDKWKLIFNSSI